MESKSLLSKSEIERLQISIRKLSQEQLVIINSEVASCLLEKAKQHIISELCDKKKLSYNNVELN